MSQEINLINPALRPKRDWLDARTVAIAAGASLVLMGLLFGYARMSASTAVSSQIAINASLTAIQQEVQAAQMALAARVPDPALEKEITDLTAAVQQRGEVLQLAESLAATSSGGVAEVMRGFSRQRVEGVWLTGFSVGPAGFDIRGRLLDPAMLPPYIRKLNAEPAFRGRSFAALDMQGILPQPANPTAGTTPVAVAMPLPVAASGPARYTEFFLRASLPTSPAPGSKE